LQDEISTSVVSSAWQQIDNDMGQNQGGGGEVKNQRKRKSMIKLSDFPRKLELLRR
jgi:hypothetical protein